MYEKLTIFLPEFKKKSFGEWIVDNKNDGSPEHPCHMPFVVYSQAVEDLLHAAYDFVNEHPEMMLNKYSEILENAGIQWSAASMRDADVSLLDGKTTAALLVGVIRADRFCEGTLLAFCEDGSIAKWLLHLQEIDQAAK